MPPKKLEQLITEIKQAENVAARDLDTVSMKTRASHEVAIRQAKEDLVRLKTEYQSLLLTAPVAFFVSGEPEKVQTFVDVAKTEGLLTFDTNDLYKAFVDAIEPTMGRTREFGIHQLQVLNANVRQIAIDAGFTEDLKAPRLTTLVSLPTSEDVQNFVRALIERTYGQDLLSAFAVTSFVKRALQTGYSKSLLGVVVVNATPAQIAGLSCFASSQEVLLGPDDVVDQSFAISVFNKAAPRSNKQKRKHQ